MRGDRKKGRTSSKVSEHLLNLRSIIDKQLVARAFFLEGSFQLPSFFVGHPFEAFDFCGQIGISALQPVDFRDKRGVLGLKNKGELEQMRA